jgi:hypothetical protein
MVAFCVEKLHIQSQHALRTVVTVGGVYFRGSVGLSQRVACRFLTPCSQPV